MINIKHHSIGHLDGKFDFTEGALLSSDEWNKLKIVPCACWMWRNDMPAEPHHLICIHYDQSLVPAYDDGCQGNPSLELTEKYKKIHDPVWKEMARKRSVKHKNDQRTRS